MAKLELSKFKKIAQDQKKTILEHPDGHVIHIAHESLPKHMKKELYALPLAEGGDAEIKWGDEDYQKGVHQEHIQSTGIKGKFTKGQSHMGTEVRKGNYQKAKDKLLDVRNEANAYMKKPNIKGLAGGGDPAQAPDLSNIQYDPNEEVAANDLGDQMAQSSQIPQSSDQVDVPDQEPTDAQAPSDDQSASDDQAAQAPDESGDDQRAPASNPDMPYQGTNPGFNSPEFQQAYQQTTQQNAQKWGQEAANFQQDLASGHITPPTYSQWFAKKSTLGKIGTLFGLMVGGMGSGLAHQPNALLAMMNQEMQNDLDAQIKSKDNAKSWLGLSQQMLVNKARAGEIQANADLIKQNAMGVARMNMNAAALDQFTRQVQAMPDGPQKQQGLSTLAFIADQIKGQNYGIAGEMGAAEARAQLLGFGQGTPGGQSAALSPQQLRNMQFLGPQGEQLSAYDQTHYIHGVPSVEGQPTSRPIGDAERNRFVQYETFDQKGRDLLNFMKQHAASLSPAQWQEAKQKANELSTYYGESMGMHATDANGQRLDDLFTKNNPLSLVSWIKANPSRFEEMLRSNKTRQNLYANSLGLIPQGTSASGKPIEFRDGRWMYKKAK